VAVAGAVAAFSWALRRTGQAFDGSSPFFDFSNVFFKAFSRFVSNVTKSWFYLSFHHISFDFRNFFDD